MYDLPEPSRVEKPAGQQDRQSSIRSMADVPERYLNYPNFEELTNDSAHGGHKHGKVIREAMTAVEADLTGIIKGPVTRPLDSPYIDFFDGEGYPFDVKTPLTPTASDKWQFDPHKNAETILKQLDKEHQNKFTGKLEPVAILLDTTYMASQDRTALWQELMRLSKNDRSVLKRIYEVNVKLDNEPVNNVIPTRNLPVPMSMYWGNLGR